MAILGQALIVDGLENTIFAFQFVEDRVKGRLYLIRIDLVVIS